MNAAGFIYDLAVIMLIAGIVTVLFHRFKQPVVLGYIVAGVIIGPYTPPFSLIQDEHTTKALAELGVVFLMFSLGLEFNVRKLARVGGTALVAALGEIIVMIWIGYQAGKWFGWNSMDSLFLGSLLAISSTTIIVKALDELGLKQEGFAHLIFGILIIEDILAIGIIALLSVFATSGSLNTWEVLLTIGKLSIFMTVALVLGILIVPRLIAYVAKFQNNEMLLVTVLGISFGFCLLVLRFDYSVALGAFVIGAVMAESDQLHTIERLIEPIRDMFSAVFFVTIGLLFDPGVLVTHILPVIVITMVVIVGKVVTCSAGTFLGGHDGRTALRVGMGLAQIGEFSFIIASLGVSLKVTGNFLFPIAVAVSSVTTFLTPYMIRFADPLTRRLADAMPQRVARIFSLYTTWLENIRPQGHRATVARIIRRVVLQVFVNIALVVTIFVGGAYFGSQFGETLASWVSGERIGNTLLWSCALLLSLPFLIAAYRKLQGLSMLLAELTMKPNAGIGEYGAGTRRLISEVIPAVFIVGVMFLIAALSAGILPPAELLAVVLSGAVGLTFMMWKRFVKVHSVLQAALLDTFESGSKGEESKGKETRNYTRP